jgi:YHS domain-containing protein
MSKHIDPVCNMQIEEKEAVGQTEYKARNDYFCSLECQQNFEKSPEQFADNS